MDVNTNLDSLKAATQSTTDKKKLMKTCEALEGEFVKIMFKEMKKTVPKDELLGESQGKEIFEDLYTEEIANSTSKNSSLGLAKMMYEQFTKTNKTKEE